MGSSRLAVAYSLGGPQSSDRIVAGRTESKICRQGTCIMLVTVLYPFYLLTTLYECIFLKQTGQRPPSSSAHKYRSIPLTCRYRSTSSAAASASLTEPGNKSSRTALATSMGPSAILLHPCTFRNISSICVVWGHQQRCALYLGRVGGETARLRHRYRIFDRGTPRFNSCSRSLMSRPRYLVLLRCAGLPGSSTCTTLCDKSC